ncbi:adenosylcobalamin-dependent ribonucleoside-diphosphate reductase [Candidatus Bipolaricaulota bacterium]|nr:adenosylcobalamin-dependent ribonucleoside-diphosphate reductase [Candidatus Bipolaricaulota bacterium]
METKKVKKRDGSIVDFDQAKIRDAILKAAQASGSSAVNRADELARKVTGDLEERYGDVEFGEEEFPEVEDIQDTVEKILIEEGHYSTAKTYILYRQEHRQKRREKEKLLNRAKIGSVGKQFSLKALRVLASRYLLRDGEGKIVESPKELFERVATNVTIPDLMRDDRVFDRQGGYSVTGELTKKYLSSFRDYGNRYNFADHRINQWTFKSMAELFSNLAEDGHMKVDFSKFLDLMDNGYFDKYHQDWQTYFDMMVTQKFLPNSPTLMNAGTRLGQLSACFVLPMEDDMGKIMDASKDAALIFQSGGGVGINYSSLRPEGDIVASTSGVASGPISFMRIIDTVTDVVKQGGKRRGANMGIINIDHPDIKDFINVKQKEGKLENFNISVGTVESFWESLKSEEKSEFELINPRTEQVVSRENPKALLELIAHSAWESADPGMIFFDRINEYNVLEPAKGKIRGTNPCGEQPLYEYESCNLGSINLHKLLGEEGFDWDKYEETIRNATRFLDNVLDMNNFPLEKIEQSTKATRKVGLGVMGLSDMLYDSSTPYNSEQGYKKMEKLAESLSYYSMNESVELAKERGSFPLYEESSYPEGEIPIAGYYERETHQKDWDALIESIKQNGIRNGMTTTIAPTGSISMIADTSHGIEPEFSLAYEKNVTAGDFYYANGVFEDRLKERGMYSEELLQKINENYGSLAGLEEIPDDLKEVFVTALDIHYTDHLTAQASWQDWVTASISKTINMPSSATPDDILNAFMLAHKLGLKGLTVYRDGSKSRQVLNMDGENAKERNLEPSDYVKNFLEEEFANTPEGDKYWETQNFSESLRSDKPQNKDLLEDDDTHPLNQVEELDECPDCGGQVIHEGGCNKCVECGWSTCSIS